MILYDWARKWNISVAALRDLQQRMGSFNETPPVHHGHSEEAVQSRLRLTASQQGAMLLRNNVGAGYLDNGRFIRWGLANDSKRMNQKNKSSDLIGIRPVVIQQHHVGLLIGQFLAREAKPEGWHYTGTDHEQAQLNFITLVNTLGGDARFANGGDQV